MQEMQDRPARPVAGTLVQTGEVACGVQCMTAIQTALATASGSPTPGALETHKVAAALTCTNRIVKTEKKYHDRKNKN